MGCNLYWENLSLSVLRQVYTYLSLHLCKILYLLKLKNISFRLIFNRYCTFLLFFHNFNKNYHLYLVNLKDLKTFSVLSFENTIFIWKLHKVDIFDLLTPLQIDCFHIWITKDNKFWWFVYHLKIKHFIKINSPKHFAT